MGKISAIIPLIFLLVLSSSSSYAYDHPAKKVLGISSESSVMPEISYGPGFVLPSSPFYALDKFKQNVRLLLALTPEEKAKVYEQIAGERLAEVRVEAMSGNEEALSIALDDVSNNIAMAAKELESVKLKGRDTEVLAKDLNDSIKQKRQVLGIFESNAGKNIAPKVKAARQKLFEEKVRVEDYLPQGMFESEMNDDLKGALEEGTKDVSSSTLKLKQALEMVKVNVMDKIQKEKKNASVGAVRQGNEVKNSIKQSSEEAKIKQRELRVKEMERIINELKKLEDGNGDLDDLNIEPVKKTIELPQVIVPSVVSSSEKD